MAVFNEPSKWQTSLVNSGDANTIPQNTPAGTGEASFEDGFPQITQVPIGAGGIAPDRKDFNGLFKILGDQIFYTQNGGVPSYNADYDYIAGRVVLYNGNIYKCIQANGASSTVVAPDSDDTYWQQLDKPSSALLPNQLIISPVPMTEANLHLLDGALLSGSGAYADYVTMMSELYTADPTATCWTDEVTWQASVTTYGECGKFVYDSVNNTLRLPKLKSFVQATTTASELGSLVEAGAPNITGQLGNTALGTRILTDGGSDGTLYADGAFTNVDAHTANLVGAGADVQENIITFDASQSNSIYGNSSTIQPQAIKYYFYIVVGTVSKTDIQIDIDNVMTDLANKADRDLSNLSASGQALFTNKADKDFSNVNAPAQAFKNMSVGWVMPDYSSGIQLTWGTEFIAPSDGVILWQCRCAQHVAASYYINSVYYPLCFLGSGDQANFSGTHIVSKNDSITYTGGVIYGDETSAIFYPCKGAN